MSKLGFLGRGGLLLAVLAIASGCAAMPAPEAREGTSPAAVPPSRPAVTTPLPDSPPSETAATVPPDQPRPTDAPRNEAPLATLLVDGTGQHPGEVGGFDFGRYTQGAPWLPATALDRIEVDAGSDLRIQLDERATVAEWAASYAAADDPTGSVLRPLGSGTAIAGFGAPPPGDWVIAVTVVYGGGAGSGAYYWHVAVS